MELEVLSNLSQRLADLDQELFEVEEKKSKIGDETTRKELTIRASRIVQEIQWIEDVLRIDSKEDH